MRCDCGIGGTHYKCRACGAHVITDREPCIRCKYFLFDEVPATQPAGVPVEIAVDVTLRKDGIETQPVAHENVRTETKRRPRGRSAVT